MINYEIIIRNESEALKLELPDAVVQRIKELSSLNDPDFKELDNEKILEFVVASLDRLLYGFDNIKPHSNKETEINVGRVSSSKK